MLEIFDKGSLCKEELFGMKLVSNTFLLELSMGPPSGSMLALYNFLTAEPPSHSL